jgi:hypothetical protein
MTEPTEKDDLFAVGTVLYEISYGQLLWIDLDDREVRRSFTEYQYPDLAGVPASLKPIIPGCWMGRYISADEVAYDVEKAEVFSGVLSRTTRLVILGLFTTFSLVVAISKGLWRSTFRWLTASGAALPLQYLRFR